MPLLLSENLNDVVDICISDFCDGFFDSEILQRLNLYRRKYLKSRGVLNILPCIEFSRLNTRLTGGAQVFRDHGLLEGLANHLAQDFLPNTSTKPLLHNFHGDFARAETRQPSISSCILQPLIDDRLNTVRRHSHG